MPNYIFNLENLPTGEYKATIVILADGRKEIAVVTKTQPDFKIPLIQDPFVILHCPLHELPPHGDLIDRDEAYARWNKGEEDVLHNAPVIVPAEREEDTP